VFAQSKTIQDRLKKWGNIPSEVLYPPPPYREYRTESYQNFIFSISRLQKLKRLHLLVEAFRHIKNKDLKAVIIGEGPEAESLSERIRSYRLEGRIQLLGAADESSIIDHYSRCLAVFFAPFREDYGLVTAEAFASRKAVVTTKDSGGPAEIVQDGVRGYVIESDPKKIAEKLDALTADPSLAETMGQSAHEFISGITWEKSVERLVLGE
jgi:glycosyltransferase involved in cell wall biosynthesis